MHKFRILIDCCCKPSGEDDENSPTKNVATTNLTQSAEISSMKLEQDNSGLILHLAIVEGTSVPMGTVLRFTPTGLDGGLRGMKDGITFIGSVKSIKGSIANDFVIEEPGEKIGKRNTMIKFDMTLKHYVIKDMGEGSGTFAKIDGLLPLHDDRSQVITFGDTHLTLKPTGTTLTVRGVGVHAADQFYTFEPINSPILIGRMVDC
jgi:hypothetical protein